jgi:hypothetical protein
VSSAIGSAKYAVDGLMAVKSSVIAQVPIDIFQPNEWCSHSRYAVVKRRMLGSIIMNEKIVIETYSLVLVNTSCKLRMPFMNQVKPGAMEMTAVMISKLPVSRVSLFFFLK